MGGGRRAIPHAYGAVLCRVGDGFELVERRRALCFLDDGTEADPTYLE